VKRKREVKHTMGNHWPFKRRRGREKLPHRSEAREQSSVEEGGPLQDRPQPQVSLVSEWTLFLSRVRRVLFLTGIGIQEHIPDKEDRGCRAAGERDRHDA